MISKWQRIAFLGLIAALAVGALSLRAQNEALERAAIQAGVAR